MKKVDRITCPNCRGHGWFWYKGERTKCGRCNGLGNVERGSGIPYTDSDGEGK